MKPNAITPLFKLELRRRKLGITRPVLAKRAKVSLTTLADVLTGRETNPRLSSIDAIARALGVSVYVGANSGITEVLSVDEMRKQRAIEKAKRIAGGVQATMGLEAQAVDQQTLDSLTEQTVHRLLAGPNRRLWAD